MHALRTFHTRLDPGRPCEAWLRHDRRGDGIGWMTRANQIGVIPAQAGIQTRLRMRIAQEDAHA